LVSPIVSFRQASPPTPSAHHYPLERIILRKIFEPAKEVNDIWRIKTNKELGSDESTN
jgi:hypothetical protein